MEEIITYTNYKEYKQELDSELQKSVEGFVKIGYLLKVARDTNILKETQYANVNEFAQAEYNIDKTMVSKWIHINDRFAEGGYSDKLQEQYRGYGYAKLAIMLQLPDALNEEITQNYSKSEIQAIKDEVDEEKKTTNIEIMLEGSNQKQEEMKQTIEKVLHQLGHDEPEKYLELFAVVTEEANQERIVKNIIEVLAPGGEAIYSIRIKGTGRVMLSLKGAETEPTVIDVRTGNKERIDWQQFVKSMECLCEGENGKKSWETLYEEEFPKKEEVAPVQPKQEARKISKVSKAKTEETQSNKKKETDKLREERKEEPQETEEAEEIEEEQLEPSEKPKEEPSEDPKEEPVEEMAAVPRTEEVKPQLAAVPAIENITDQTEIVEKVEAEIAKNEVNTECELKKDALEYAEMYILDPLKRWQEENITEEVVDVCIDDTKQLLAILEQLSEEVSRKEHNE